MRTILIGDLHGCLREWEKLLAACAFREEEDRLVLLGDLMNKGRDSFGVWQKAEKLKERMGERFVCVRGNHDDLLLRAALHPEEKYLRFYHGVPETELSFREGGQPLSACAAFLSDLPYYAETEHFFCVHAGLRAEDPAEEDPRVLLSDRTMQGGPAYGGKLVIAGHVPGASPLYRAPSGELLSLPCGQTLTLPEHGYLCLDTGCVYGNALTAMVTDGKTYRLYAVPSSRRSGRTYSSQPS